jgi:hypothetical protein
MTDRELMQEALEAMLSAINAGDWKVDGACDPHATIIRLTNRLAQPEPDAVLVEREACAKVVEADANARGKGGGGLVLLKAASRIRARGEK